jgi:hypothetical protein
MSAANKPELKPGRETAAMRENPEVEISRVIRNNTLVAELKSYIKGLQYQSGSAPEK